MKTVIGHTEGTAGIAGLLKASLAVKHGVIPPNMLFENLSPKVAPFYQHLRITKEAQPWPEIPHGAPRRASVNSFGRPIRSETITNVKRDGTNCSQASVVQMLMRSLRSIDSRIYSANS